MLLELELELWSLVTSCKKNNTVETSCWGTRCRVIVRRSHSKLSRDVISVGLVAGSDNGQCGRQQPKAKEWRCQESQTKNVHGNAADDGVMTVTNGSTIHVDIPEKKSEKLTCKTIKNNPQQPTKHSLAHCYYGGNTRRTPLCSWHLLTFLNAFGPAILKVQEGVAHHQPGWIWLRLPRMFCSVGLVGLFLVSDDIRHRVKWGSTCHNKRAKLGHFEKANIVGDNRKQSP